MCLSFPYRGNICALIISTCLPQISCDDGGGSMAMTEAICNYTFQLTLNRGFTINYYQGCIFSSFKI